MNERISVICHPNEKQTSESVDPYAYDGWETQKKCGRCGKVLPFKFFNKANKGKYRLQSWCIKCNAENAFDWSHRTGRKISMDQNQKCSSYLGVHIAESILSRYFKGIQRMPYGHKGYDYICSKGYKIDVKSGCMRYRGPYKYWAFSVWKNKMPDYYMFLAFDNRDKLNPEHIWLIPGAVVNNRDCITVSYNRLKDWSEYERPINKVIECCDSMKVVA